MVHACLVSEYCITMLVIYKIQYMSFFLSITAFGMEKILKDARRKLPSSAFLAVDKFFRSSIWSLEQTPPMPLRLKISAGPNHSQLEHISPNNDYSPFRIASDCFQGDLRVRIKNFNGLAPTFSSIDILSSSPYFNINSNCTYSIDLRGRFLVSDISFDDLVFGNVFEKRIRLPPGSSLAISFVKRWIDPGLELNLDCDQPWAASPVIVTMNTVVEKLIHRPLATQLDIGCLLGCSDPTIPMQELSSYPQNNDRLVNTDAKKRKKYYSSSTSVRKESFYRTDTFYGFDFCNGMADFNEFAIRVPGWGFVNILPFWDGQVGIQYYTIIDSLFCRV